MTKKNNKSMRLLSLVYKVLLPNAHHFIRKSSQKVSYTFFNVKETISSVFQKVQIYIIAKDFFDISLQKLKNAL